MSQGRQFRKLFGASLKMMFREKQVWFWNIFFPIILMSIFMVIFGGGGSSDFKAKIAVVQPAHSQAADGMLAHLRQLPIFEWKSDQPVSAEQADVWIKDKAVDAVVVLPSDANAGSVQMIVNTENERNATSQAVSGILNQVVQEENFKAANAAPTFKLDMTSVTSGSQDLSYVDFLMTGMIALSIAQGGLFGMVELVEMRRKGLLKRLRMTPVKMGLLGLASMMVRFMLGVFQIIVLALIGTFGFGAHLHINVVTLIVAFCIGSLAFNAIGYVISSFSKSMESYMGVANITSFLMMFISGIFFPTNSLPDWLQPVTQAMPLTYFVEGLRDGMVYGSGLGSGQFWLGTGILVLWTAVAYLVGATLYRRTQVVEAR